MEKLFHGCLEVVESDSGYFPVRFTPGQLWNYGENQFFKDRSLCTAGITMDFVSSQQIVSFTYRALLFVRPFLSFDIYEDGVLTETIHRGDQPASGKVEYQRRSVEPSRITIYLPNTAQVILNNLNPDWKPVPAPCGKRVLFLGDSITQGMVAKSPSITYTNLLARHYSADALNQAIGGDQYRAETLEENLGFNPEVIFVSYGTNDSTIIDSIDQIEGNVVSYYKRLRTIYPCQRIVVITPIWRADYQESPQRRKKLDSVAKIIQQCAQDHGCETVNGLELVPHQTELLEDGTLHPNDAGFREYAKNLINQIDPL